MEHLVGELTGEMERAATELRFEAAARLRDKLLSLKQVQQDARIVSTNRKISTWSPTTRAPMRHA